MEIDKMSNDQGTDPTTPEAKKKQVNQQFFFRRLFSNANKSLNDLINKNKILNDLLTNLGIRVAGNQRYNRVGLEQAQKKSKARLLERLLRIRRRRTQGSRVEPEEEPKKKEVIVSMLPQEEEESTNQPVSRTSTKTEKPTPILGFSNFFKAKKPPSKPEVLTSSNSPKNPEEPRPNSASKRRWWPPSFKFR